MTIYPWIQLSALALPLGYAAWIDYRSHRIPNKILVLALVAGLVLQLIFAEYSSLPGQLVWALLVLAGLLVFRQLVAGAFGLGDVKMAAVCALFLRPLPWLGMMLLACLIVFAWYGGRVWLASRSAPGAATRPAKLFAFGPALWLGYIVAASGQAAGLFRGLFG